MPQPPGTLTAFQNPIWVGGKPWETNRNYHAHNLHTASYQGSQHLAYSKLSRSADGLNNTNANIIMNSHYEMVAELLKSHDLTELDPHEFELIDNGTKVIQLGRIRRPSDWPYGKDGVIGESVLQLVDIATGDVEFEWRSLDQVPLDESCHTYPDIDYFHLNSAAKDSEGDYIINGYHVCTIYKINGTDGSIIWRLGGKKSDFTMLDGYELMRMHHIRIRPLDSIKLPTALRAQVTDTTHLALSIFDNAVIRPSAGSSASIVVLLDLEARTGQVVERYVQPDGMFGALFGSVQFLPNGDRFIGWGGQRSISQYTQNNELVFHAELADAATPTFSYRAFIGSWVGLPTTNPDVFSYSWTCTWQTTMYASWNGATEVRSWRFFGGVSASGPFKLAVAVNKVGFETRAVASFFASHAYVEGVGWDGALLGRSEIVATRVPRPDLAAYCNEFRCDQKINWTEADWFQHCRSETLNILGIVAVQAVLE
ncbi:hypothetical protein OEA41_005906 [Lepraria neglecta]|uniref:ASST-domain-containing protein n=1 Tax=Lepraria neglecta TaxID=209136 RepID=A0AAD9ZA88_9LECA|nr:hypothetical protein OEA41_005906 [Lepraria neglecta]